MVHQNCGLAVEAILKASVVEKSLDNITVVIIAFKHFRKKLKSEMDEFQKALNRQNHVADASIETLDSSLIEDSFAAEQTEKKILESPNDRSRSKDSGIQICKRLNLPNYDLTLADIEIQPALVGIGRVQKRTTGALPGSKFVNQNI